MIAISRMPKISLNNNAVKAIIGRIAADVTKIIRDRTLTGNDVDKRPFQPYSESYLKYKQAHKIKGTLVKLRDTGKMLQALMWRYLSPTHAQVYIKDATRDFIGSIHQTGAGHMPERKWFGVNKADADKIFLKHGSKGVLKHD